jgi:23S rRNA pseudouridine2605 synthase
MKERLQKIIARAGIASRRKAEEFILEGRVTVNGKVVRELGAQADPASDHVKVNGKLIRPEALEYYAVNKPRGMLSSVTDQRDRPVVTRLIPSSKRLYPAGRLDYHSEGLMILTNDGELARAIMDAGGLEKIYLVKVHQAPSEDKLDKLRQGIRIGPVHYGACRIRLVRPGDNPWYQVALKEGKNRQIRNMFEKIGHSVMRLRRVAIGGVRLGKLKPGEYRRLSAQEVGMLKGERKVSRDVYRNR